MFRQVPPLYFHVPPRKVSHTFFRCTSLACKSHFLSLYCLVSTSHFLSFYLSGKYLTLSSLCTYAAMLPLSFFVLLLQVPHILFPFNPLASNFHFFLCTASASTTHFLSLYHSNKYLTFFWLVPLREVPHTCIHCIIPASTLHFPIPLRQVPHTFFTCNTSASTSQLLFLYRCGKYLIISILVPLR